MKDKGYVQVYTGNGKGKTTACLGLALRAAGAGYKTFIGQFMKNGDYSELNGLEKLAPYVDIAQFGGGKFVFGKPSEADVLMAKKGFELCREKMLSGKYDIIIMDEINVAVSLGLVILEEVVSMIKEKPPYIELVLTGRGADPEIMRQADLVTEMQEIKHYYKQGVEARTGIEK